MYFSLDTREPLCCARRVAHTPPIFCQDCARLLPTGCPSTPNCTYLSTAILTPLQDLEGTERHNPRSDVLAHHRLKIIWHRGTSRPFTPALHYKSHAFRDFMPALLVPTGHELQIVAAMLDVLQSIEGLGQSHVVIEPRRSLAKVAGRTRCHQVHNVVGPAFEDWNNMIDMQDYTIICLAHSTILAPKQCPLEHLKSDREWDALAFRHARRLASCRRCSPLDLVRRPTLLRPRPRCQRSSLAAYRLRPI